MQEAGCFVSNAGHVYRSPQLIELETMLIHIIHQGEMLQLRRNNAMLGICRFLSNEAFKKN